MIKSQRVEGVMRVGKVGGLTAVLSAGLMWGALAAGAIVNNREPDPAVWLRQVYGLYLRAVKSSALDDQATYRLVVKRASKSLASLFKKNDACEAKEKGICAIDWDFIIDGQDSQLSKFNVGPLVAVGDKGTVTVKFKNYGDNVNIYEFVRENGQWKVDDIVTQTGTDAPIRIAKLLRDYDAKP